MPRPLVVAGYSVGELAAWGVAGLLDYEECPDLAAQRAAAMDKSTTEPSGLSGDPRSYARRGGSDLHRPTGAYVAIVNAEDQMLVGGTRKALDAVVHDAQAAGAERTTMLPVAVPSHTPLLAEASARSGKHLSSAPARRVPSDVRLLSGIDGDTVFDVRAGADNWRAKSNRPWIGLPAWSRAARPASPRLLNSDLATRSPA